MSYLQSHFACSTVKVTLEEENKCFMKPVKRIAPPQMLFNQPMESRITYCSTQNPVTVEHGDEKRFLNEKEKVGSFLFQHCVFFGNFRHCWPLTICCFVFKE